ncbi:MAG TPA: HdeD family acid-resistance protein [Longimicrobium sp.]|nr:HdeD family acid-resistance protein [Longimicrobium sp.]
MTPTPMPNHATTTTTTTTTGGIPQRGQMADTLARNWGLVALRGVAGIVFGLLILSNPLLSLAVLMMLFGIYSLVDGVVTVVAAVANRRNQPRWGSFLASGLLGAAAGIIILARPGWTAVGLGYLIAAWAFATGIGEIAAGIRLRREITGEWLLMLAGAVLVALGLALALVPGAGALALTWWIGMAAVILGAVRIGAAFRLWHWRDERPAAGERAA